MPIQNDEEKIKRLQDYINILELSLKFTEDSENQRELELKNEKESHKSTEQL